MILETFCLLCSLGTVAFCATGRRMTQYGFWLAGFVLAVLTINPDMLFLPWQPLVSVESAQFSVVTFLVALWFLADTRRIRIPLFMSGILTVLWVSTLNLQGLPLFPSFLLAGSLTLTAILATLHRKQFSSELIGEEAMGIVMILAMGVAFIPEIIDGWKSAASLQGGEISSLNTPDDTTVVLVVSALFIILGAFFSRWKHR